MRPQRALDLIKEMRSQPMFTAKEARAQGVSPSALQYFVKSGRLELVRRGVYRDPKAPSSDDIRFADLADAALSVPGSTICLISALSVYDLTEEIPRQHWLAVRHDTTVKARPPIRIVRYRNADLGRTEINLGGVQVSIYDRERTIIDTFRVLPLETAIKALRSALNARGPNKLKLNLIRLQSYAKKLRTPIQPYLLTLTT